MSKPPSILKEFRSFCYQNNIEDFERAVEYFSVFGGTGWYIDMSKPLDILIEEKILKNYRHQNKNIESST